MKVLLRLLPIFLLTLAAASPRASTAAEPADTSSSRPPTREESAAYLASQRATLRLNIRPDDRVQDTKAWRVKADEILNKIPNEHIDLIVKELVVISKVFSAETPIYLQNINQRDLGVQQRAVFIEHLRDVPLLIRVIVHNKWIKAAEQAIIATAKTTEVLPSSYVMALLRINSPEAHALLPEKLLQGTSSTMAQSYAELRKKSETLPASRLRADEFPYLNIASLVDRVWKSARTRMQDGPIHYAPIAACYGHRDALVLMAKWLVSERDEHMRHEKILFQKVGNTLKSLVSIENQSPEAIARYVFDNRNKLIFDEASGTYSLPK